MSEENEMTVYCASPPALAAAAEAYPGNDAGRLADALIAAHHPNLGLDRSVCLRDVIMRLRSLAVVGLVRGERRAVLDAADYLERRFGAQESERP